MEPNHHQTPSPGPEPGTSPDPVETWSVEITIFYHARSLSKGVVRLPDFLNTEVDGQTEEILRQYRRMVDKREQVKRVLIEVRRPDDSLASTHTLESLPQADYEKYCGMDLRPSFLPLTKVQR